MPSEPVSRKAAMVKMTTPKNDSQPFGSSQTDLDFAMETELRTLRTYFLNGEFRKANNFLHEKLVKPEGEIAQD